ncbi:MAG: ABC transporter ATP-binding protein [Acidimicrobiia bacterium]
MSEVAAPLLAVRDLLVRFGRGPDAPLGVDGASLEIGEGEVVGLVGESGSGKTVTALSVLGLLPPSARVERGRILFRGVDLLTLGRSERRAMRGGTISMVFQDPLTSLHPSFPVGAQIAEAIRAHRKISRAQAAAEAAEMLRLVGIPDPGRRAGEYPHQWSGGMRQRAMIAMSVANRPALLIADEPTTALDVTVQAQIIELLRTLKRESGAGMLLITHDLGVVAELCDRVVVMYGGRIAESAPAGELFATPRHHYTSGLLASVPRLDRPVEEPVGSVGQPATPGRHRGCPFVYRCPVGASRQECRDDPPPLRALDEGGTVLVACHCPRDAQ